MLSIAAAIRQAGIVQIGRGKRAIEQAHSAGLFHANVDASHPSIVGAEKGDHDAGRVGDGDVAR